MGIGGGFVVFGLLLWAGFWIAPSPYWRPGGEFGVIRNPPRWVSVLTGARGRLEIETLIFQAWAFLLVVVGLLAALKTFDVAAERAAIIVAFFGGGIVAGLATVFIAVVGRLRARRGDDSPRSN